MTNLQFERVMNQAHDLLDEQGIVAIKVIFPAYNLTDGFRNDLVQNQFGHFLTRRNMIVVITFDINTLGLYSAHEMLGYMIATAYQYSPTSMKVI